jgi:hypothetical protein
LAEPPIFGCHGIERLDLGLVGIAEANMGDGTRQAHQFPSKAASNGVMSRVQHKVGHLANIRRYLLADASKARL